MLEGDALGLSPAGLEWTRALARRLRDVAERDGVDAVYAALIGEVLGDGAWESFPPEIRETLSANGAALLAEVAYVNEPMPGAAAFATIQQPILLVAATDSPPGAGDDRGDGACAAQRPARDGGWWAPVDPAGPEILAFVRETLLRE